MNVLVVILVCLVFAFQTGSAIKQSQTLVEIWCGGDDNLTQGVCRALDSEFASSPDFVVSRDEKPGTLIVRISSNVDWKEKGNRTGRFSAKTEYTLQRTGWYPGRQVPDKLASWKSNEMLSHFEMFPTAERILLEFGGLRVDEQGPGETYA